MFTIAFFLPGMAPVVYVVAAAALQWAVEVGVWDKSGKAGGGDRGFTLADGFAFADRVPATGESVGGAKVVFVKPPATGTGLTTPIPEGASVLARWAGGSIWYLGRVKRANEDGTYHVLYADGSWDDAVPASHVKLTWNTYFPPRG